MKTKDIIALLQKADPSGELEVSVGNSDITYVAKLEGYYDGSQEILIKDGYNVVGAKFNHSGHKIVIYYNPISEILWDKPDLPVDYSDLNEYRRERYKESHDLVRTKAKDMHRQMEIELLCEWVKEKAINLISGGVLEGLLGVCERYYDENLNYENPIPSDIPILNESYVSRRKKQWDRELQVNYNGYEIVLSRK